MMYSNDAVVYHLLLEHIITYLLVCLSKDNLGLRYEPLTAFSRILFIKNHIEQNQNYCYYVLRGVNCVIRILISV